MRLISTRLTTHATVRARARSVCQPRRNVRRLRRLRHLHRLLRRQSVGAEGNGAGGIARTVAATWCAEGSQEISVAVEGGATTMNVAAEGNGAGETARTVA